MRLSQLTYSLLALTGLAHAAAVLSPRQTAITYLNPNDDPFYKVPANISAYKLGQVISKRAVSTSISSSSLSASYQISYRTQNASGEASSSVATLFIPKKPDSSPKLFSLQFYEDSVQLDCAPSYALLKGSNSSNVPTAALDSPIFINWALDAGIYALVADHEGRSAAFISGQQEGRAILDAIRASLADQHLPATKTAIGFYGYSGGAHATTWAANLAPTYAKELNIIGAAYGGTPIDPQNLFNFLNGGPFAGFAGAGVVGLMNAYPELYNWVTDRLTPEGKTQLDKARARGACIGTVAIGFPFVNFLT